MSLVLESDQLVQLSERRFERRLRGLLAEPGTQAHLSLAGQEGTKQLRAQCAKARSFGMTAELDIARYVITAWLLGADFDTRFAAMDDILQTDRLTPSQKAQAIESVCSAVLGELGEGRG